MKTTSTALILLATIFGLVTPLKAQIPSTGGRVVVWGTNSQGQLNIPVAAQSGVVAIAAGYHHVFALKSDGTVLAWGRSDEGQTNVPAGLSGVKAIASGASLGLALKNDGTLVTWGDNSNGQLSIPLAAQSDIVAMSAGWEFTVVLKSNGTLVEWGGNDLGQLNIPAGLNGVTAIAAGAKFMAALKSDHTMTMWGNPYGGITSVPSGLNDITAISAGIFHTMALRSNGTVVSWGENSSGVDTTVPSGLNSVVAIAAGGKHSLALKSDGSIIAWGRNNEGQITIPVFPGKPVDIQAGAYFSVALIDDNLTLSASGVHGTISGAGIYQAGTTAVLTVAPSLGYIFSGWSGDASGTTNPLSVLMNANKNIIANFPPDTADDDHDGLTNYEEIVVRGTNPTLQDTDGDGVKDALDAFPLNLNETLDTDHDEIGDNADLDDDGDGFSDADEIALYLTNPKRADSDGDGLSDPDEIQIHLTNPNLADTDSDGLRDGEEFTTYHTNPKVGDSDGDGFLDGYEVLTGKSPLNVLDKPALVAEVKRAIEYVFPAAIGKTYRIEASSDLTTWTTVESGIAGTGAQIQRFYSISNTGKQFYRVEEEGP